jgi:hypothetical protein
VPESVVPERKPCVMFTAFDFIGGRTTARFKRYEKYKRQQLKKK